MIFLVTTIILQDPNILCFQLDGETSNVKITKLREGPFNLSKGNIKTVKKWI